MASNAENVSIWWRHHGDIVLSWSALKKSPLLLQECAFARDGDYNVGNFLITDNNIEIYISFASSFDLTEYGLS